MIYLAPLALSVFVEYKGNFDIQRYRTFGARHLSCKIFFVVGLLGDGKSLLTGKRILISEDIELFRWAPSVLRSIFRDNNLLSWDAIYDRVFGLRLNMSYWAPTLMTSKEINEDIEHFLKYRTFLTVPKVTIYHILGAIGIKPLI